MKKLSKDGRKIAELWFETILGMQTELDMRFGDGIRSVKFQTEDWEKVAVAFDRKLKGYIDN